MIYIMYVNMVTSALTLVCLALLSGCASKAKLPGHREPLVASTAELTEDKTLLLQPIRMPDCRVSANCTQANETFTHEVSNQCFDIDGAKFIWDVFVGRESSEKERLLSNIVVYNNVVFGGTSSGRVFAVDVATHKLLWRADVARKVEDAARIGGVAITGTGHLAVTAASGDVVLLDPATGAVHKKVNLGCTIRSAPTICPDRIFVQGSTNALFALDNQLNIV
ncbi:MAG: PQQ-binding-like beta-propeller repeat protein, partial [Holosporales bacterium]|nr:PQQ-binding-like beta-propeller repeat protein [Holosporales bacterium]